MKKGFSLIELLVVIAITAVLTAIALPNFLSARERARDAKRKQEMDEMKNSLRLYYNDHQTYPLNESASGKLNYIKGCGLNGDEMCPCTSDEQNADFAVGVDCVTVYMKRFPSEFGSRIFYTQTEAGNDFCLKSSLENAGDPDIATSRCRCATACGVINCATAVGTDYYVCAD